MSYLGMGILASQHRANNLASAPRPLFRACFTVGYAAQWLFNLLTLSRVGAGTWQLLDDQIKNSDNLFSCGLLQKKRGKETIYTSLRVRLSLNT